ncbi:isopentenyl-diphosphate delta-isomerase [Actinomycetospora cinnamomea]|uniref:Isopentenyl-diphosphate Delta-isomerase n=1 Tax=Actinomycetospora cinnamomea TaxID=663609 RepID=A0A2U1FM40_9PSEU|nr:isopentenyl-diphosphate Delta-isomerase [Actinomycetospora cinnamomea]PVZ13253.1 isopentenyl-diphosphate delta-isomerase [Actinomycetospora cinnamomea]
MGIIERVVLLDESGRVAGTAAKAEVHHDSTPLHLAFSCYVFDARGELLVTRRARSKTTFPGVWTNTFCGHPAPGEPMDTAIRRRARQELGLELDALRLVLPGFRYRAEQGGVFENEMCPVFVARTAAAPGAPDPSEVDEVRAVAWAPFRDDVLAGTWPGISPWCADQVRDLAPLGPDPGRWADGDPRALPPAAFLES